MAEETSEAIYTVVLTGVRDEDAKKKVAETLARITTNLPTDKALKRMGSLPWTLTRRATAKNAERLAKVMEQTRSHRQGFCNAGRGNVSRINRNTGFGWQQVSDR